MKQRSQDISTATEAPFPRWFGSHVLINRLGEGGMGRVYLALERVGKDTRLCVVKKFGNPDARFTPEQIEENRERFRREANISMALSHPSIVRTFKSVQDGAKAYLVQEFVRGMTLEYFMSQASLDKSRFSVSLAAYVVAQIAGALAYVHSFQGLGLIHRDLSGSNVMFSNDGDVKIIDFGIAKTTLLDNSLTRPNVIVGKQMWTAPEVVAGAKPDSRTDLYALGLLFWYLLTSQDPTSHLATSGELRPPSTTVPECPKEVDAIVLKAAAPRPEHRYQSAAELLAAVAPLIPRGYRGKDELADQMLRYLSPFSEKCLDEAIAEARLLLESATPKASWLPRRKRLALALGGIAIVLGVGIWVALGIPSDNGPAPSPSAVPAPAPVPVAAKPAPATTVSTPPPSAVLQPAPPPKPTPIPPPTPTVATTAPPAALHPAGLARTAQKSPPRRSAESPEAPRPEAPQATPAALLDSAIAAYGRSQNSEALALARLAAKNGAGAGAYLLIGRILFDTDPSGARAALETALRLSPGEKHAARLLDDLKSTPP